LVDTPREKSKNNKPRKTIIGFVGRGGWGGGGGGGGGVGWGNISGKERPRRLTRSR